MKGLAKPMCSSYPPSTFAHDVTSLRDVNDWDRSSAVYARPGILQDAPAVILQNLDTGLLSMPLYRILECSSFHSDRRIYQLSDCGA